MQNESAQRVSFVLGLEVGTDFADLFTVKDRDFARQPGARAAAAAGEPELEDAAAARLRRRRLAGVDPRVLARRRGRRRHARSRVELDPRAEWAVSVGVTPSTESTDRFHPEWPDVEHRFGEAGARPGVAGLVAAAPAQLRASWDPLHHAFHQSVADLASLRLRSGDGMGKLPAAGVPWFMTVFGRDTIIASLQTLLFGPELAITALRVLADLQADSDDPEIDAEPGRSSTSSAAGRRPRVVRAVLRAASTHAALPDPALGGLALDGR